MVFLKAHCHSVRGNPARVSQHNTPCNHRAATILGECSSMVSQHNTPCSSILVAHCAGSNTRLNHHTAWTAQPTPAELAGLGGCHPEQDTSANHCSATPKASYTSNMYTSDITRLLTNPSCTTHCQQATMLESVNHTTGV